MYWNRDRLISLISFFVSEKEKNYCGNDVSFDDKNIIYRYEVNTSCHCHPEYQTKEKLYPLEDFLAWVEKNKEEIEQYTENDFDDNGKFKPE